MTPRQGFTDVVSSFRWPGHQQCILKLNGDLLSSGIWYLTSHNRWDSKMTRHTLDTVPYRANHDYFSSQKENFSALLCHWANNSRVVSCMYRSIHADSSSVFVLCFLHLLNLSVLRIIYTHTHTIPTVSERMPYRPCVNLWKKASKTSPRRRWLTRWAVSEPYPRSRGRGWDVSYSGQRDPSVPRRVLKNPFLLSFILVQVGARGTQERSFGDSG